MAGSGNDSEFPPSYGAMFTDVKQTRRSVGILCLLLWAIALALPTAYTQSDDDFPGFLILIMGPFGPFILQPGWYANPVFVFCAGWMAFGGRVWRWVGVLLGVLALWSFTWDQIVMDSGNIPITKFGPGFYLWELAMLSFAVYVLIEPSLKKAEQ